MKEELKEQISQIFKIFINAKENYNYCYYLHNPKTNLEKEYIEKSRHLKFLRHSLWRITIIELAKLYSNKKNDRFRLTRLIERFWSEKEFGELNIEPITILGWESRISAKEIAIQHILTLRDKVYAHTDVITENSGKVDLFFYDIDFLLETAGSIISDIYRVALDSQIDLRTPIFDRNEFDIIKLLAGLKN